MKIKAKFSYNMILLIILALLIVIITIIEPAFFTVRYILQVVLKNIVEIGILVLPMALIIISGGIDFAVGSEMLLAGIVGGMAGARFGDTAGLTMTIVAGGILGLLNGLLIVKIKVTPMVATLSTYFLYMGIGRVVSGGESVHGFAAAALIGTKEIGNVPIQIFIWLALAAVFYYILKYTATGRKIYAIGLNENGAVYSGINVNKIKIVMYTVMGFVASLAAIIYIGRFTSIKYNSASDMNMNVITVAVLGGLSLNGGKGDIPGVLLGTLIIATLNSGLTVLNIPIAIQTIVQGIVLMLALAVGVAMNKRK